MSQVFECLHNVVVYAINWKFYKIVVICNHQWLKSRQMRNFYKSFYCYFEKDKSGNKSFTTNHEAALLETQNKSTCINQENNKQQNNLPKLMPPTKFVNFRLHVWNKSSLISRRRHQTCSNSLNYNNLRVTSHKTLTLAPTTISLFLNFLRQLFRISKTSQRQPTPLKVHSNLHRSKSVEKKQNSVRISMRNSSCRQIERWSTLCN